MQLVSGKENWINQLLKTKSNIFTNPDGEGLDMDEIMLALSEEWGDKGSAESRRAAIAEKKASAIKAQNEKKAEDYIKQLALMRGAIQEYSGEKGSREYQARLRKIENLEASLKTNPEFKNHEVLGEGAPQFMYDESLKVVKPGDLILSHHELWKITGFNHKKREYVLSNLSPEAIQPMITRSVARSFREYYYNNDKPLHIANAGEADIEKYKALLSHSLYIEKPIEFKKENFTDYVNMNIEDYSWRSKNPIYRVDEDGKVINAKYDYGDGKQIINPYTDEGKAKLLRAVEKGELDKKEYDNISIHWGLLSSKIEDGLKKAFGNGHIVSTKRSVYVLLQR